MRTLLIIGIASAVLWFAIANASTITLNLFIWNVDISLALFTGITLLIGFLLGVLRLAPGFWRGRSAAKKSEKELADIRGRHDVLAERSRVLEEQIHKLAPEDPNKF